MKALPSRMLRFTDWTQVPLGHWFVLAGKPITTEGLWKEELENRD